MVAPAGLIAVAMTYPVENDDHRLRRTTDNTAASRGLHAVNAAIVDFLQLLARAVRQFHTYPATSPLCTDAIETCHRAFMALELEQPLGFRVAPGELILDDDAVGRGTIIEQELSRPLHRARVASLEIDCAVSVRDWCQLCEILAAGGRTHSTASFAELMLDSGVAAIVPRMTPRPEVLELGAPPSAVQTLVERERTRQASLGAGSPAQHLYPPDKGWVRLDPTVGFDVISLLDLTVLVNDPGELAAMLTRLIDDTPADEAADGVALEQRYSDVVMLISALDPRLGRLLFSKLAHAVLALDSERRRGLLRRAILPGLLDQRLDGEMVLGEFPDVDLADALCLLLDLEAASPDLLPLALDRLQLKPERRAGLVPLIDSNVKKRSTSLQAVDRWASSGLERQAGTLTRIESGVTKSFGEFAAFDLSINEHTTAVLAGVRETIVTAEGIDAQLTCGLGLAKIEPNPAVVAAVLGRGLPALRALVRGHRWQDLTRWIAKLSEIADELELPRPDVAKVVRETLRNLSDRELVLQLAHLCATEPERTYAAAIAAGLGQSIVPAWLEALDAPADRARIRPFAGLMSECARRVAPAIVERLPTLGSDAARAAVAVLGFAGAGYESAIAGQVTEGDQRRSREALGALARIGSAKAAALIAAQLERGAIAVETAAEEALWHLPGSLGLAKARELLGRREFVTRHPRSAARLLERAAHGSGEGIDGVLESLLPLRFHFWSPAVARVGAKARSLLR
jgi:hypothetical protein